MIYPEVSKQVHTPCAELKVAPDAILHCEEMRAAPDTMPYPPLGAVPPNWESTRVPELHFVMYLVTEMRDKDKRYKEC